MTIYDDSESSCFAWFQDAVTPGRDRQALWTRAKWQFGDTISISFLDGDPVVRDRVREVAREWLSRTGANLNFSFRSDTTDTLVRITFAGRDQWSVIGTDCRRREPGRPTMALGGLTAASADADVRRKALHEFGHLLGMVHEHSLTDAPIVWDRDAVFDDLDGRWTRDQIEQNLFRPILASEHNAVAFDPASIMIYPIKARWTKNGFTSDYNTDLSPGDLAFIRDQYT